jgi:signal peptidase I
VAPLDQPTGKWGVSARPELGLDIWVDNSAAAKASGDSKKKQSVLIRTISNNQRVRSALFHLSDEVTLIPTFTQGPDFASIAQEEFEEDQVVYNRPYQIPMPVAAAVANRTVKQQRRKLTLPKSRQSIDNSQPQSYQEQPSNLWQQEDLIPARSRGRSAGRSKAAFKAFESVAMGLLAVFVLLIAFQVLQLRVVLSGSMLPVLKIGDVVLVENTKYRKPQINDIVLYTARALDGTPVTTYAHRIIGGSAQGGWTIKGDNNNQPDYGLKANKDVKGVVILTIPKLGRLLSPIPIALMLGGIWLISLSIGQLRKMFSPTRDRY